MRPVGGQGAASQPPHRSGVTFGASARLTHQPPPSLEDGRPRGALLWLLEGGRGKKSRQENKDTTSTATGREAVATGEGGGSGCQEGHKV